MGSTQSDFNDAKKKGDQLIQKAKDDAAAKKRIDDATQRSKVLDQDIKRLTTQIDQFKTSKKAEEKILGDDRARYTNYLKSLPANPSQDQLTHLSELNNAVSAQKVIVDEYDALITKYTKEQNDKIAQKTVQDSIKTDPKGQYHKPNSDKKVDNKVVDKKNKGSKPVLPPGTGGKKDPRNAQYRYNVQMVSEAYFNPFSLQAKELAEQGLFVDPGNYQNARQAWQGQGGRGTIQMDAIFASEQSINDLYLGKKDAPPLDANLYGFKFLYNPQTIGMAWGVQQETVPSFEASGQDLVNPIASGLVTSTLSFSLMLNRIRDMHYLDANGLKVIEGVSNDGSDLDQIKAATQNIRQLTSTITGVVNGKSPYPDGTKVEDLKEIYQKGTMYDMEYLFRTIQGPHGNFQSNINGWTADKGWMRPSIVEVHLGNRLRYRARITELSINHAVFDARMVPILSTVNMTLARFNDYQTTDYSNYNQTPKTP